MSTLFVFVNDNCVHFVRVCVCMAATNQSNRDQVTNTTTIIITTTELFNDQEFFFGIYFFNMESEPIPKKTRILNE